MSPILPLVGLVLLLLVLPLVPLGVALYIAFYLAIKPRQSRSMKALLAVAFLICLTPYIYIYGRQFYRNALCTSEGFLESSFNPVVWASEHPEEAEGLRPPSPDERRHRIGPGTYSETLNSGFTSLEKFTDRGFSVTENFFQVIEVRSGVVVARGRTFFLPIGSGKELISFSIKAPRSCYVDPKYYELLKSIRSMGHHK